MAFVVVSTERIQDQDEEWTDGQSQVVAIRPDRASALQRAREEAAKVVEGQGEGYFTSFHTGSPMSEDNLTSFGIYDEGSESGGEDGETYGRHVHTITFYEVRDVVS